MKRYEADPDKRGLVRHHQRSDDASRGDARAHAVRQPPEAPGVSGAQSNSTHPDKTPPARAAEMPADRETAQAEREQQVQQQDPEQGGPAHA